VAFILKTIKTEPFAGNALLAKKVKIRDKMAFKIQIKSKD
jgi:hypothetical protein